MLDYNSVSPIQSKDMKTPCRMVTLRPNGSEIVPVSGILYRRMVTLRPNGSEIVPVSGILYQRPTDKTVKFRYYRIDI